MTNSRSIIMPLNTVKNIFFTDPIRNQILEPDSSELIRKSSEVYLFLFLYFFNFFLVVSLLRVVFDRDLYRRHIKALAICLTQIDRTLPNTRKLHSCIFFTQERFLTNPISSKSILSIG